MNPNASVEERRYEEITSFDALTRVAEVALAEYNATHKPNMDIVLFRYCLPFIACCSYYFSILSTITQVIRT